jgi:two-component system phosphate regulon sensor histidine kinase PhoR
MRITLRWKMALMYGALVVALTAALGASIEGAVRERMTEALQETLRSQCLIVRNIITGGERTRTPAEMDAEAKFLGGELSERVTFIAADGKVLGDTEHDPLTMENHNTRPEVVEARASGSGSAIRRSDTLQIDMLYVAVTDPSGLVVRTALPLTYVESASAGLRRAVLLAAIIAAALGLIASAWLAGTVTRSLGRVAAAARRVARGDFEAQARVSSRDEVADLAGVLNSMTRDLKDRIDREQETAQRLRAILVQMADGVIVVGTDEKVELLNAAAEGFFGVSAERAVGRRISEVAIDYELADLATRTLRLGVPASTEIRVAEPQERALAATASPIELQDGRPIAAVIVLRDLTEARRVEHVRRDFVANASHELRTPVAAIRALAETLEAGALTDPVAGPNFLGQIVSHTTSLTTLLDDMMQLARLEGTEQRLKPKHTAILPMLTRAAERLQPQAEAKRVVISISAPKGLELYADPDGLQGAIVNLMDNAVKYTPAGGRIMASAEAEGDRVHIRISDTGVGIPPEDLERIFERFYRVDKARSRALGGTGLGLSIVKHAVEASGGKVWAESEPGKGSTFSVLLPSKKPE